jgi:hypothetical protein
LVKRDGGFMDISVDKVLGLTDGRGMLTLVSTVFLSSVFIGIGYTVLGEMERHTFNLERTQ